MNEIPNIFKDLHKVKQSAVLAENLRGRITGSKIGIVVENNDPDNQRRIKVQFDFMPKGVNSHWVMRASTSQGRDEPVPEIGQTVLIDFLNGDVTKGFYRVIQNLVNAPHEVKEDPLLDDSLIIDGNKYVKVTGKHDIASNSEVKTVETSIQTSSNTNNITTDTSYSVDAGTSIDVKSTTSTNIEAGVNVDIKATANLKAEALTINVTSGAATTVSSGGALAISAPAITITSGGTVVATVGADGSITLNTNNLTLNTSSMKINGNLDVTGSAKINGKSIAVIGGSVNTSGGSGTITTSGQ